MVTPSSYRPQALDTRVATDRFEFALLRHRPNSDRLIMSMALKKGDRELCLCVIRQTYASLDEQSTLFQGEVHQLIGRVRLAGGGAFYRMML